VRSTSLNKSIVYLDSFKVSHPDFGREFRLRIMRYFCKSVVKPSASLQKWWFLLFLVTTLSGCFNDDFNKNIPTVQTNTLSQNSSSEVANVICPIPPIGYERIPGYQPGSVDPSLSQKSIEFISPTLEGNPSFYLGILQQPVRFCGIAKDNIVKVKLFASGAYIYEQQDSIPEEPELLLGEVPVENGLWFFSYDFRGVGVRDIIAKGYDANDQLIATTSGISISLAEPNPR
jgi:hypothetical protein